MRRPPLLAIDGLTVEFRTADRHVTAVRDLSLTIGHGETVAVVGESGSGKSVTALSVMRLVEHGGGRITAGSIRFEGPERGVVDLVTASGRTMRQIRGGEIAMIFQEPMTSLNPVFPVHSTWRRASETQADMARGSRRSGRERRACRSASADARREQVAVQATRQARENRRCRPPARTPASAAPARRNARSVARLGAQDGSGAAADGTPGGGRPPERAVRRARRRSHPAHRESWRLSARRLAVPAASPLAGRRGHRPWSGCSSATTLGPAWTEDSVARVEEHTPDRPRRRAGRRRPSVARRPWRSAPQAGCARRTGCAGS